MRRLAHQRFAPLLLPLALAACDADPAQMRDPTARLPGGETTNTLLLGTNAFSLPAKNISVDNERMFFSGNSFFNQAWVTAPASTQNRDGLGPLFNARACSTCHFRDGRGAPPDPGESFSGLLLRLSVGELDAQGRPTPDPVYGGQLQPFAVADVPAEGDPKVVYTPVEGTYADATAYTLLAPTYQIDELAYGPLGDDIHISPRVAPQMIGMGLLEAIPAARLEALADPDDVNGDGISGRVNRVWDAETEGQRIGRFGWKAEQPTVRAQVIGAFLGDIGITTEARPNQTCTAAQSECAEALDGGAPEIEPHLLDRVVVYSSLLAVPIRRDMDAAEVLKGEALFGSAGCGDCHVPRHETGPAEFEEVANQIIWPYTDLLLHDMGPALADDRPVFGANGQEWRTPPLWGLGLVPVVNRHDRLMHDGRARGVAEAILWHGGEGEASANAFRALDAVERAALVRFVGSL